MRVTCASNLCLETSACTGPRAAPLGPTCGRGGRGGCWGGCIKDCVRCEDTMRCFASSLVACHFGASIAAGNRRDGRSTDHKGFMHRGRANRAARRQQTSPATCASCTTRSGGCHEPTEHELVTNVLNEPGRRRDAGVRRPLGLVTVAIETGLFRQCSSGRRVPGRFAHRSRIDVVTAIGHELDRDERQEESKTHPVPPATGWELHRHLRAAACCDGPQIREHTPCRRRSS